MSKAYFEDKERGIAIGMATDEFWSDNMPIVVFFKREAKTFGINKENKAKKYSCIINRTDYTLKDFEDIFNPQNYVGNSMYDVSFYNVNKKSLLDLIVEFPVATPNNIAESSKHEKKVLDWWLTSG